MICSHENTNSTDFPSSADLQMSLCDRLIDAYLVWIRKCPACQK